MGWLPSHKPNAILWEATGIQEHHVDVARKAECNGICPYSRIEVRAEPWVKPQARGHSILG